MGDRNVQNIAEMFRGYITAALWSSIDEEGTPLDHERDLSDIDETTLASLRETVAEFYSGYRVDLFLYVQYKDVDPQWGTAWDYVGHDLWLTSNGHGAGFWDRDEVPKAIRDRLTEGARALGEINLFVGDDGVIYA